MSFRAILYNTKQFIALFLVKLLCLKIKGIKVNQVTAYCISCFLNFRKQFWAQIFTTIFTVYPQRIYIGNIPTIHFSNTTGDDLSVIVSYLFVERIKQHFLFGGYLGKVVLYKSVDDLFGVTVFAFFNFVFHIILVFQISNDGRKQSFENRVFVKRLLFNDTS